jgi:hypothetical protein
MQYPAVDFDYLERETERQKRLQQEARKALELKKARLRDPDAPPRPPAMPVESTKEPAPARPVPMTERPVAAVTESIDKVRTIPELRSALIPLDPELEGDSWSKPFSLPKADLEPWQSYLRGYYESRLFPEARQKEGPRDETALDFGVQALLELKRIEPRLIIEPVVQIDQPVEYLDLAGELRKCTDPLQARSLAGIANDVHEAQLRKAIETGRALGDHLCDALLGDGHANLIKAWERLYHRKPNVSELHVMLSTGRVKVIVEAPKSANESLAPRAAQQPVADTRDNPVEEPASMTSMASTGSQEAGKTGQPKQSAQSSQSSQSSHPSQTPPLNRRPLVAIVGDDDMDGVSTPAPEPHAGFMKSLAKKFRFSNRQKIILHALHLAVCCAAIAAYLHFM